jgi:hypothetical protein
MSAVFDPTSLFVGTGRPWPSQVLEVTIGLPRQSRRQSPVPLPYQKR